MSTKQKRKTRRDIAQFADRNGIELRKLRPNLYKSPQLRGALYDAFFERTATSRMHRRQIRIRGLPRRISEEIALTSW